MHSLPDILENMKQNLLSKRSKKTAWKIIKEYFSFFGLETIREELWILTKGAITNDLVDQSEKGEDRYDLIFHYEFLVLFTDAVNVLNDKRKKKQKQPDYLPASNKIKSQKNEAKITAAAREPKGSA